MKILLKDTIFHILHLESESETNLQIANWVYVTFIWHILKGTIRKLCWRALNLVSSLCSLWSPSQVKQHLAVCTAHFWLCLSACSIHLLGLAGHVFVLHCEDYFDLNWLLLLISLWVSTPKLHAVLFLTI